MMSVFRNAHERTDFLSTLPKLFNFVYRLGEESISTVGTSDSLYIVGHQPTAKQTSLSSSKILTF